MSVDSACSSSLTAFHLGCQSVWSGESELAVIGGVNIILRPEYFIAMCKGGFLSLDGRCKAFDASADGYGRGEGAGVVLIKPLSAALAAGDRIYATVLATAVNQDGRTSGITVPNRDAQEAILRRVCNEAGLSPSSIRYVEAHGTGTQVGDPIEANALGAVLSQGRDPDDVCFVGSVKSNIGHLEAAAGIAGVIKTALILSKRAVPPNLHFETPNLKIDFEGLRLRVPTRCLSLDGPLYAGINSFGYGGANAHAVLGEAPPLQECTSGNGMSSVPGTKPRLFIISGRSETALKQAAEEMANWLEAQPRLNLADVQYTLARRASHRYRRAVWSECPEALAQALRSDTGVSGRSRQENTSRLVFVYPGMGAQWWGMGARLYEVDPVFRDTIQTCDRMWQRLGEPSLLPRPDDRDAVNALRQRGAEVLVRAIDVSDAGQVAKLFANIAALGLPLRGVYHAATTIDDGMLASIDPQRFVTSLQAKAKGAWLLHQHTQDIALDHFVLYSSIAALTGNPGQAAYAAANAFLDALARWRRGQGLAALSVAWGVIGDAGVVARSKDLLGHLERQGARAMTSNTALAALSPVLRDGSVSVVIADLDWQRMAESFPSVRSPRFAYVASHGDRIGSRKSRLQEKLDQLVPTERRTYITEELQQVFSKVLRVDAARLETDIGLDHLGVDSLLATELAVEVETSLGVTLPNVLLLRGPTIDEVAAEIVGMVSQVAVEEEPGIVDQLSEAELDALLEQLQ